MPRAGPTTIASVAKSTTSGPEHPVEELLHERLAGPAEAVVPDGGGINTHSDRAFYWELSLCVDYP